MDPKTATPFGSLGPFFPQQAPLPAPTKQSLSGIKFHGKRTDLEVYHLAYGTKKLRACTYRRMEKRQKAKNQRKGELLLPKSAEQKTIKASKEAWLREIEEIVNKQNLKTVIPNKRPIRRFNRPSPNLKGIGKKKRILKKKIKAKILGLPTIDTEMKDC